MAVQVLDRSVATLSDAVLKAACEHETPEAVSRALVNSAKRLCGCHRVSLAILEDGASADKLTLVAISDQASVDTRKVLPSRITAAMREGLNSDGPLYLDREQLAKKGLQFPAIALLFSDHGRCPSLVIVYPIQQVRGAMPYARTCHRWTKVVMLLERPVGQSFSVVQTRAVPMFLEPSADLVSRLFDAQRTIRQQLAQRWRMLFDLCSVRSFAARQQWAIVACVLLLVSLFFPVNFRISAKAAIEAKDLQVMGAPQDGFVASSHVRAGERVEAGQLMATLDVQDLELSLDKWSSESVKNAQAMQQALATRDRIAMGRLRADARRITAERSLVERQLARSRLLAPFNGIVLSGDLSQKLGSPVKQGEALFTVASSNEYQLVLDVEEYDVGLVESGQPALVRMSALPNDVWQASIEAVLPVATSANDQHVFRVRADLSSHDSSLLPGMEGIARVQVGIKSAAWVYTRRLREKTRLLFWRLGLIH